MKTILGTLLALGLLSTTASAEYCPPAYSFSVKPIYGHSYHEPTHMVAPEAKIVTPDDEAEAKPIEPEPLPQDEQEAVPPK